MLVKYKSDYKKIAMGLLSFIPGLKDVNRLETEISWYQDDDSRVLYLWRNENGDFSGIVGVEVSDEIVVIRQIALSPSERSQIAYNQVLDEVAHQYPDCKMMGSLDVASIIAKWEHQNESKHE
ncbi:N-acetyltransferase [Ligilactobacillus aviarius]|uniref:N-acetyltransferase n=1 Tax=Ligilactobacillus aviarius TaxID=1606 RepID=UPI00195DA0AE|nr:N-acetyltransferase [Ligilactobacillus aviarius]MBM6862775.1 N-acetyltransferase [Ligilactobacillus aviarius]